MTNKRSKVWSDPPRAMRLASDPIRWDGLFELPGSALTLESGIPALAARVHETLLRRLAAAHDSESTRALAELVLRLRTTDRQELLLHPLLVRYLHCLAPVCVQTQRWHAQIAAPDSGTDDGVPDGSLTGNLLLPLLLRAEPNWRGTLRLQTDAFGRLCFPTSDWSITLRAAGSTSCSAAAVLVHEPVMVAVESQHVRWSRTDADGQPFLSMPRGDALGILVGNNADVRAADLRCADRLVRPVLQKMSPLGGTGIRYDPVAIAEREHAALTGGIVNSLLSAIGGNAPLVYCELCRYVKAIRGFDVPASTDGFLQSFSDPREPGVIGINVCYTPEGQPRFDPTFLTCLAHELAHTKSYLIESIIDHAGEALAHNPSAWTGIIPRYQRRLKVRTLLQIPYTHFYEWVLLMCFMKHGFHGLAWARSQTARAIGDDLEQEIEEAFGLIEAYAELTGLGVSVVSRLRMQFSYLQARWAAQRVHALR